MAFVKRQTNERITITADMMNYITFGRRDSETQHLLKMELLTRARSALLGLAESMNGDISIGPINWTDVTSCSFCGYTLHGDEFPDLPGCCDAAQLEWVALHPTFQAPASWELSDNELLRDLKLRVAFPDPNLTINPGMPMTDMVNRMLSKTTDDHTVDGSPEGTE